MHIMRRANCLISRSHSSSSHQVIRAVIFDLAGTICDYGSIAPVRAIANAVRKYSNIEVSDEEVRRGMGMSKREHIQKLLHNTKEISSRFFSVSGRMPIDNDVENIFSLLQQDKETLIKGSDAIEGAKFTLEKLRRNGVLLGCTTGYNRDVAEEVIAKNNFQFDAIVTASDVPQGRPHPWMASTCGLKLGVWPRNFNTVAKVDDTTAGLLAGWRCGMVTIGICKSGNEVGLSEEELRKVDKQETEMLLERGRKKLKMDGKADYVIDGVWDLVPLIDAEF